MRRATRQRPQCEHELDTDARELERLGPAGCHRGAPLRSARAEQLLERLGLGDRLHHKPNELSGGQQQRVSIARALMNGGQIILADEPTGALDSRTGEEILALFKELNGQGRTIIMVTHDPAVAAHCPRQIHLRDGRVVEDG